METFRLMSFAYLIHFLYCYFIFPVKLKDYVDIEWWWRFGHGKDNKRWDFLVALFVNSIFWSLSVTFPLTYDSYIGARSVLLTFILLVLPSLAAFGLYYTRKIIPHLLYQVILCLMIFVYYHIVLFTE